jgi:curved DNA-binding protein CbpA
MGKDGKQSYYEVLDVSFNASPEIIRTAYIRAKNAYNRDSLATYSLFDREESRRILDDIEEAYTVLSDSEKRRKYDESHGIISSESIYESYHRGNHAVAAFSRASQTEQRSDGEGFDFENDPFRKAADANKAPAEGGGKTLSPIDRLRAMANTGDASGTPRSYQVSRSYEENPEMEERIKKLEGVNGAFLRSVREYKQITADEIMNLLKIGRNYLTALEEDNFSKLPANVFVRGFVIQYAKALKLDHDKVAAAYMEFLRGKRPG